MSEEMTFTKKEEFTRDLTLNDAFYKAVIQAPSDPLQLAKEKGNSYAIRVDWILKSAIKLTADGARYMHFIVRKTNRDGTVGETMPPSQYTLWAEGTGDEGEMVVAEDFPPKIWP
jgi:hypothetical protein